MYTPLGDGSYLQKDLPGPSSSGGLEGFVECLSSSPHYVQHLLPGILGDLCKAGGKVEYSVAKMLGVDLHGR